MKTPAVVVTVAAALVIGAQARTLRADGPTAAPFTKRSCAAAAVLATMAAPGADIYPPEQTAADLAFPSDDVGASLYAIGRYLAARGMPVRAYKTPDSVAVPVPFIAYMAGQAHFVVVVARTKRYVAFYDGGLLLAKPRPEFDKAFGGIALATSSPYNPEVSVASGAIELADIPGDDWAAAVATIHNGSHQSVTFEASQSDCQCTLVDIRDCQGIPPGGNGTCKVRFRADVFGTPRVFARRILLTPANGALVQLFLLGSVGPARE